MLQNISSIVWSNKISVLIQLILIQTLFFDIFYIIEAFLEALRKI